MKTAAPSVEPNGATVFAQERVEAIERIVRAQIDEQRLYPGCALAVYRDGELALNIVAGYADTQAATVVDRETLFPLFSGSKPLAAVALWQQIEAGRIGLDDRVTEFWPDFGRCGKETVLVRHILSHRGGFPRTPESLPAASWADPQQVLAAIEQMHPDYAPGTVSAYHFLTQHWVIAELVRLLDGRPYETYLQQEILDPLQLENTFIVLPSDLEDRCVKLHATDGTDDWGIEILKSMHAAPIYRMVVPGASLVSTASDMARFYAAIGMGGSIDGQRILRSETVGRMLTIAVDDQVDPSFDLPVRRSFGFEIGGLDEPRRHWPGATSTTRTFWHGGMGTSVCWGERESGLSFAFLANGIRRDKAGAIARRDLSDMVRQAFGRSE
jgi:CubicO group peptidase (beta-lactamase class C family)